MFLLTLLFLTIFAVPVKYSTVYISKNVKDFSHKFKVIGPINFIVNKTALLFIELYVSTTISIKEFPEYVFYSYHTLSQSDKLTKDFTHILIV